MESKGYAGKINTRQYAALSGEWGATAHVLGDSWRVVAEPSVDRGLRITAGTGFGYGVEDTTDVDVIVDGDLVTSGTHRWDTIVARRDWRPRPDTDTSDRTTFEVIPGGLQRAIANGVLGPTGAGVRADQPLAAVQFLPGSTVPRAIVDLRTWKGDGGFVARDDLVRSFYAKLGTRITVAPPGPTGAVDAPAPVRYELLPSQQQDGSIQPGWQVTDVFGAIPLFGAGTVLDPPNNVGLPDGISLAGIKVQAGSQVSVTSDAGLSDLVFPREFPNGLLTVLFTNGDDFAANDTSYHVAGGGIGAGAGTRQRVTYRVWGPNGAGGRVWLRGYQHRVNWLALGF